MITFLEGIVDSKQPATVIMNVGGIGHEVNIPLSSYDRLPREKESCRILTYDHIREDDHVLYGFMTEDERRMFIMLMSVTGIGPRLALATLGGLTVRELKAAIASADIKRLSSVSGIGRKTAERIVVDLKDKIGVIEGVAALAANAPLSPDDIKTRDAILALISLGYKRNEAEEMTRRAMARSPADATIETLVRKALASNE